MWDTYEVNSLNLSDEQRALLTMDIQTLSQEFKNITKAELINIKLTTVEALKQATQDLTDKTTATTALNQWRHKPIEFPEELWQWVEDEQKVLVKERYARFSKSRLAELLAEIKAIKADTSTFARQLEEPLFRAQAYANVDAFGHPDPDNAPTCKGHRMDIKLNAENVRPAKCRPRRVSEMERCFLKRQVEYMVSKKQLEASNSAWAQPIMLVPFPDRIKAFQDEHGELTQVRMHEDAYKNKVRRLYRLTIDMRYLNEYTVLERFPLPLIQDLLDHCRGKFRFTSTDVADAFHTVELGAGSRHMTAFSTPDGHYQYRVMTMGSKNAANIWAGIVHEVFGDISLDELIVYQDDLVNHASASLANHLRVQQTIYNRCRTKHMILKPDKTFFNFAAQKILGHVLSKEGRRVDPSLVEAILNVSPPQDISSVRSLLGLAQVAREYLPRLATELEPIQALTRKGVNIPATWDPAVHGVAFEKLKVLLTSAPVLRLPDPSKPFVIHCDACRVGKGLGALLLQRDEDAVLRPVAYWSRGLNTAERNYSATGLECTAMHNCILHWSVYLQNGLPFEVFTDHYALV